ncbi:ATP-binding protein [Actinomadura alba]|nr:ATP-binding protein [Actinomadura alba]
MDAIRAMRGRTRLEVTLFPVPQSPGLARTFVRHQLISLGHPELVEDACVIVSELVTNAIAETPGKEIRVYLSANDGRPLIEVWDSSPTYPVMPVRDLYAESGRGLMLTQALAAEFGCWRSENGGTGKILWALLK